MTDDLTFDLIDRIVLQAVESGHLGKTKEFDLYLHPNTLDALMDGVHVVPADTGVEPGRVVYNSPYGRVNLIAKG